MCILPFIELFQKGWALNKALYTPHLILSTWQCCEVGSISEFYKIVLEKLNSLPKDKYLEYMNLNPGLFLPQRTCSGSQFPCLNLLYSQTMSNSFKMHLEQWLASSWHLRDMCWMNEWMNASSLEAPLTPLQNSVALSTLSQDLFQSSIIRLPRR